MLKNRNILPSGQNRKKKRRKFLLIRHSKYSTVLSKIQTAFSAIWPTVYDHTKKLSNISEKILILTFYLGGVNGALGAIEGFYDNYKKRNHLGMVINAISFFSGLSAATGNPIGQVISLFLTVVNTGLKIFQKETAVKTETESERLERIINKALKEYRETGLKAEWQGYERLSELFGSNVQFMAEFDEEKVIAQKEKGGAKTSDNVQQAMFDIVVSRLYDVLMSSTVLLGKVEYEISKQCDIEVESAEIKESRIRKQKKEGKTKPTDEDNLEQTAKDCLGMYELYSKMNFHRETNFIKHLNIISDILDKEDDLKPKRSSIDSRREALAYKHLILNVIDQMKENNRAVFKPLVDPFKSVKLRYIINYYYSYRTNYDYLRAYLDNLDLKNDELKDIMLCAVHHLSEQS